MTLRTLLISAAAIALISAPALALNPQPEPPGKSQVMNQSPNATNTSRGTMSTGAHAGGAASDADDNYCGTPTPGHPHAVACTNVNVNAGAHMNGAMGGAGANASADADDNYCGTPAPGHHNPHSNWGSLGMRTNTAARCNNVKTAPMQGGAMTH